MHIKTTKSFERFWSSSPKDLKFHNHLWWQGGGRCRGRYRSFSAVWTACKYTFQYPYIYFGLPANISFKTNLYILDCLQIYFSMSTKIFLTAWKYYICWYLQIYLGLQHIYFWMLKKMDCLQIYFSMPANIFVECLQIYFLMPTNIFQTAWKYIFSMPTNIFQTACK